MSHHLELYNTLKQIYFILDTGDRRFLGQFSLTVPRFFALQHIADFPGISMTALSERLQADKSKITRLIRNLEKDDMVIRKPSPNDGRAARLYLSAEATELLQQIVQAHNDFTTVRLAEASYPLDDLIEQLNRIKESLEIQLGGTASKSDAIE
jgi:DNA-binding MarR family transcriptional regulator